MKKKASFTPLNKGKGKKSSSITHDPFFEAAERKKKGKFDEEIESSDGEFDSEADDVEKDEEIEETPADKRKRLADGFLESIRAKKRKEEDDDDEDDQERDLNIAKLLQQEQLEDSGRARRAIASRVRKPETSEGFRFIVKHRQPVTSVALSEDDSRGFSASKDGKIIHWDVESGKIEKYVWPSDEVLKSHGMKEPQGRATKQSKHVLALAVSSDGRYLASGGLDRHVHLWDVRTREHVKAFPGHKGPVSCLTFRHGTSELFSGSFDRSIKIWNAEDRTYINTLFGHQSEVLTIDSLRKERVLTAGRDRTMHLWKVPEESTLIFRASASSLESCCFISNDEFLTGSDDGSVEHWNVLRKKPVHIVKNAHVSSSISELEQISNGHKDTDALDASRLGQTAHSLVNSVAVCRNTDLAASGAGNGLVRLWEIENESKGIRPLFELPLVGFVNSLVFAKSGKFLIAGVGQEPRLGRWGRVTTSKNGVALCPLGLS